MASINEVLDLGVQREANIRAKLPFNLFVVLIGLSLVGAGMMGFAYPAIGLMRIGSSLLLFMLLTLTISVLIDLDSPAGGGVRIDQTPMQQLVKDFRATASVRRASSRDGAWLLARLVGGGERVLAHLSPS